MSDKPICVHGYSDGHFFDQPDEQEQPSWCVGPITAEMSDRTREAIKQLELRGARVATQAAKDGIGTDLVKVLDAARRFANLTSPETIEKGLRDEIEEAVYTVMRTYRIDDPKLVAQGAIEGMTRWFAARSESWADFAGDSVADYGLRSVEEGNQ